MPSSAVSLFQIFGEEVREHRLENRKTLKEVAGDTGIHYANLCSIESGKRPCSVEMMQRIAEYYNKKLDIRFVASSRLEEICFIVIYGGQIHGVGLDSESAWREAEMALNIERETLKDMGYFLREGRVHKE